MKKDALAGLARKKRKGKISPGLETSKYFCERFLNSLSLAIFLLILILLNIESTLSNI